MVLNQAAVLAADQAGANPSAEVEIEKDPRCSALFAAIAAKNAKCLSDRPAASQFFAAIVLASNRMAAAIEVAGRVLAVIGAVEMIEDRAMKTGRCLALFAKNAVKSAKCHLNQHRASRFSVMLVSVKMAATVATAADKIPERLKISSKS